MMQKINAVKKKTEKQTKKTHLKIVTKLIYIEPFFLTKWNASYPILHTDILVARNIIHNDKEPWIILHFYP